MNISIYNKLINNIGKSIKHVLNEEQIVNPTVADVICNKLKLASLPGFTKQNNDSYQTKYISADYVNNNLTRALTENNWQFTDFFRHNDTYARYAYKCILSNSNPKELYSTYISKKTLPLFTEFSEIFNGLHKKIKQIIIENTPDWFYISPDNGIIIFKTGKITAMFTGVKKYSSISSKASDQAKQDLIKQRSERAKEYNDRDDVKKYKCKRSIYNAFEKYIDKINTRLDIKLEPMFTGGLRNQIYFANVFNASQKYIYGDFSLKQQLSTDFESLKTKINKCFSRWSSEDNSVFTSPDNNIQVKLYSNYPANTKIIMFVYITQNMINKYEQTYDCNLGMKNVDDTTNIKIEEKLNGSEFKYGFDNSNTNIYLKQEELFAEARPDEAEIIRYIFNKYKNKIQDCGINTDAIYACTGENFSYKYQRSLAITIKGHKLYFNDMSVDVIDIQNIMKDVSSKFNIDCYYDYDDSWGITNDKRYGTTPHYDFDEYEEEWSEPDKFFISHRSLKKK